MADTVRTESANSFLRSWRILMYATSILGFNNVTMCSWFPQKLRMASLIYHGLMLLIYAISTTAFAVGLRLDESIYLWASELVYFSLIICGAFLCAANVWFSFTERPTDYLQIWTKCNMPQIKNKKQAFILSIVPLVMATFALISCHYHAYTMAKYADDLAGYLFPFIVDGKKAQCTIYWMVVIISEMILLGTSLYSALVYNTMIEIYVCVTALHQDLLSICAERYVSSHALQIWRRKFRCQEKVLRSVNDSSGGSVLAPLTMCVSILILVSTRVIGQMTADISLVLTICNTIIVICGLTLPSAILD